MSNELLDLRESFDFTTLDNESLTKSIDISKKAFDRSVLSLQAKQDSVGINTSNLTRSTGGSKLATRSTTQVKSTTGNSRKTITKRDSNN